MSYIVTRFNPPETNQWLGTKDFEDLALANKWKDHAESLHRFKYKVYKMEEL